MIRTYDVKKKEIKNNWYGQYGLWTIMDYMDAMG
jgi:hypothetical protein